MFFQVFVPFHKHILTKEANRDFTPAILDFTRIFTMFEMEFCPITEFQEMLNTKLAYNQKFSTKGEKRK